MPERRTLFEDWVARREQLAKLPYGSRDHYTVEAHVLDYLLRRYRDTPEGAQPARFPHTTGTYINHRAIAVLHHLESGGVSTVTTASEALARVQSIVRRMSSQESGNEAPDTENFDLKSTSADAIDVCRMRLCESDPITRLLAIVRLGRIGTLDDIGLLSDLLALAPSSQEHPKERAAMIYSMQRLAGIVAKPFDLSGVVLSPPGPAERFQWGTPSSQAGDNKLHIPAWAAIGAGCGVTAAVLSVVIAFFRDPRHEERGSVYETGWMVGSIMLLVLIEGLLGTVAGFLLTYRKGREKRRIAATPPPRT